MSAIKRAVAQKSATQQAEVIVAQDIPVEVAMPAVGKALDAIQVADDRFEQMQNIALDAQHDLPVDLAQIAEEFHAQSIAFADQRSEGAVLLAQAAGKSKDGLAGAAQGDSDKGAAGDLASDDGGVFGDLGGGGIAALVGLGLIAAAGGGGGGGSSANVPGTQDGVITTFTSGSIKGYTLNSNNPGSGNYNNVIALNQALNFAVGEDKIDLSGYVLHSEYTTVPPISGNNISWTAFVTLDVYLIKGTYTSGSFKQDLTGRDYLILMEGYGGNNQNIEYGGAILGANSYQYSSNTLTFA